MGMNLFPITIIDDFFEDPDQIHDLALEIDYNPRGPTAFPGVVSNPLNEISSELVQWLSEKMVSIYFGHYTWMNWRNDVDIHKEDPYPDKDSILNRGAIHWDGGNCQLAGVVYLNKKPSRDAGTSFYTTKNQFFNSHRKDFQAQYLPKLKKYHAGEDVPDIEEVYSDYINQFEETARVQAKYNRLIMYDPTLWHGPTTLGDQTRYTLRTFMSGITSQHETFPLARVL